MQARFRHLAETTAFSILQSIGAEGAPARIVLAKYETQLDYETLRPEDKPAALADHTAMIDLIALRLRQALGHRGFTIETPVLNSAQYLRWLAANNLTNDPATRARFIANPPAP